jgi:hypothetical protein
MPSTKQVTTGDLTGEAAREEMARRAAHPVSADEVRQAAVAEVAEARRRAAMIEAGK